MDLDGDALAETTLVWGGSGHVDTAMLAAARNAVVVFDVSGGNDAAFDIVAAGDARAAARPSLESRGGLFVHVGGAVRDGARAPMDVAFVENDVPRRQAALALAQCEVAAGLAFGAGRAPEMGGGLGGAVVAFVAAPPPNAAPEVALALRNAFVSVDAASSELVEAARGGVRVDVVDGFLDDDAAALVRDIVARGVADGPRLSGLGPTRDERREARRAARRDRAGGALNDTRSAPVFGTDYGGVVVRGPGPAAAAAARRAAAFVDPGASVGRDYGGVVVRAAPAAASHRFRAPAFHK